ncbi:hypothetical protein BASA83_009701 [Batrachochytrium salamandrivorans]|nr:hypothetical protein BASA83_009701 [Batrachochytrium salamandrivorans]
MHWAAESPMEKQSMWSVLAGLTTRTWSGPFNEHGGSVRTYLGYTTDIFSRMAVHGSRISSSKFLILLSTAASGRELTAVFSRNSLVHSGVWVSLSSVMPVMPVMPEFGAFNGVAASSCTHKESRPKYFAAYKIKEITPTHTHPSNKSFQSKA